MNKQEIKASFNKASESYDGAAVLQKEVANRLFERISLIQTFPRKILDLGCGTGFLTEKLASAFPNSEIVALDIAENMVHKARGNLKNCRTKLEFVCGDMHQTEFEPGSFDLIVSNLTFQWSFDLKKLFAEINRLLHEDGLVFFSMVGENSLFELKQAYQAIFPEQSFMDFTDIKNLTESMKLGGLNQMVLENEIITLDYESVHLLLKDLKNIGAKPKMNKSGNETKINHGLIGKHKWQRFINHYPKHNNYSPATYNIFYAHAFRASISRNHQRLTQSVRIDQFI